MLKCEMSVAAEMAEGGRIALLWEDNEGEEERFVITGGQEGGADDDMAALASWLKDCFRRELAQLVDRAAPKEKEKEEEKPEQQEKPQRPAAPVRRPVR